MSWKLTAFADRLLALFCEKYRLKYLFIGQDKKMKEKQISFRPKLRKFIANIPPLQVAVV